MIGLGLCPFAKAVHTQKQIRYVSTQASTPAELLVDLKREMLYLIATDAKVVETTLIVHPNTLNNFRDFINFSDSTNALILDLELRCEIQIATFHPNYQFAGSNKDDIENFSNRSPYPTLQLLREPSVEEAIEKFGDTAKIFEKNIQTLRALGPEGWKKLELDKE